MALAGKKKVEITSLDQLDLNAVYTYADYITWKFTERVELIKGKIFKMSPAPNSYHQEISANFVGIFYNYLKHKKCKVFSAPFDVRLPNPKVKSGRILNVVQPDMCIICDLSILDDAGCKGAPDIVIEILSSSTSKKDKKDKFDLYEQNGVKEYWLVEPFDKSIIIYTLNEKGKFVSLQRPMTEGDKIKTSIFKDLVIVVDEVFDRKENL